MFLSALLTLLGLRRPGAKPTRQASLSGVRVSPLMLASGRSLAAGPEPTVLPQDSDDDEYADFVRRMWNSASVHVGRVSLTCDQQPCDLFSVTPGRDYPYLNLVTEGRRVTYAADSRHEWGFAGRAIDTSAFRAILAGVPCEEALSVDSPPTTVAEALAKDRIATQDRRFVICYRNSSDQMSWRVISRLWRGHDRMTARCHYRWGERRTFLYECLDTIIDIETGEVMRLADFVAGLPLPPRRARKKEQRA